jgi:alkanesulfonate monooxygenase SsuD/methylene tetrahydromethanopterin reductase-like flavin-dependent oxidoreductase (luciferase family)
MHFGTYYFLQATPGRPASLIIQEEVEQMIRSEQLGFDSVWLTEHHYSDYGLSSSPSTLFAYVAGRTSRVKLGLAVYVIPFHHPLRLAEETATLDILSGGRLVVGLGRGNRPIEFLGHGIVQDTSRPRLQEGTEILLQAWSDRPVRFSGQYWQIENIPVYPKPLQRPHPPIAFAVGSEESIRWTGLNGYPMLSSGLFRPLSDSLRSRQTYEGALREGGHSEPTIKMLLGQWVLSKHVYVAPTDEEALADTEGPEGWYIDSYARSINPEGLPGLSEATYNGAMRAVQEMHRLRWPELVHDCLLIGSPATVRAKVAQLAEAGVGELLCWMNFGGIPHEKALRSMRLFAEQVMPAFRRETVPAPSSIPA